MKELILLVGPPGSGKSSFAAEMMAERDLFPNLKSSYINQDTQNKNHLTYFNDAISINSPVIIVDRMNFNKEQRDRYLKPAKEAGYSTRIIVLHVPNDVCRERMKQRKDHPTIKDDKTAAKVLNFFFKSYERVTDDEADVVERRGWEGEKPKAIICDLDGTLCNIDHRLHFVKGDNKNWKDFFYNIPYDSVNEWCQDILECMSFANENVIVFASGRPDNYRKDTAEWLNNNEIPGEELFMRPRGDYRKDDIIKEVILDFEILPRFDPYFVIDDRKQVVEMWRRRGLVCLQCAEGAF